MCIRDRDIVFPKSSVGAAQQAILAAVLAKGVTHLYNCAKEPEVFWLCRYLKTMGALIEGEETGEITIRGVDELKGGDYRIPPDRIVAGTYLCAAAAARSKIILHDVPVEELQSFMEVYRKIGGQYLSLIHILQYPILMHLHLWRMMKLRRLRIMTKRQTVLPCLLYTSRCV